eukprot:5076228-Pyramimonas_sp.AAC.1
MQADGRYVQTVNPVMLRKEGVLLEAGGEAGEEDTALQADEELVQRSTQVGRCFYVVRSECVAAGGVV